MNSSTNFHLLFLWYFEGDHLLNTLTVQRWPESFICYYTTWRCATFGYHHGPKVRIPARFRGTSISTSPYLLFGSFTIF